MAPRAAATDGAGAPRLQRFLQVTLELAPDVLVPRQETELLGLSAIARLRDDPPGATVIDMCCGCGNLALAIAMAVPSSRIWAADMTDSTVALARRNAERLGLQDRVSVRQGDLFGALEHDGLAGTTDMIVCNPPYISSARLEGESAHLLAAEPRAAFDGGPYGISIHQRLVRDAADFLRPGGWLLFEFGQGQDRQVAALIARAKAYEPVSFATDEAGIPRVACVRRLGSAVSSVPPAANGT
ncbi:HemK/PrmC family methyltransferase [Bosea sp. (in: a-proteobacteria)]|uniref:N5-glutamine methyltransferase family protein n=1 Tax=Bosea sp. (in: a-proteobacteria) TaxID=1871050 RepID=UPI001ACA47F7|nr:HemK/PrmC family methyltransferase [Bosea sp. (in: a-proteobacteria)]MBN9443589.1 peptide chain release factor N(5)-glutamine methyltransferase [Bosea sp. (in: a-proteobacteria)]